MPRRTYHRVGLGVDTLEVNAYGSLAEHMPPLLDALQEIAKEERDEQHHRKARDAVRLETYWELRGQPLLIAPHGVGEGQFRWFITCSAAVFRVAQRNMNEIAVKVRLSSPFLWEYGYWQAWEDVRRLLDEWGEFTYQVSEIHACVDVAGYPLDALHDKHFTRRGHVVRWHQEDALILDVKPEKEADERDQSVVSVRYGEQEGLAFSPAAAHSVTIYNKPREIRLKSRDKIWFTDIWKENGWNGLDPVTRIEARYERDILREFGIETPEEAFQRLDEMWAYTTQKWMRHTTPKSDKRRSTWPTSKWWELVQSTVFERRDAAPAQREHVHSFHEKRILSAILGYIESYAAWMLDDLGEGNTSHLDGTMSYLIQRAQRHYEERGSGFHEQVRLKRLKIGRALTKEEAAFYERTASSD